MESTCKIFDRKFGLEDCFSHDGKFLTLIAMMSFWIFKKLYSFFKENTSTNIQDPSEIENDQSALQNCTSILVLKSKINLHASSESNNELTLHSGDEDSLGQSHHVGESKVNENQIIVSEKTVISQNAATEKYSRDFKKSVVESSSCVQNVQNEVSPKHHTDESSAGAYIITDNTSTNFTSIPNPRKVKSPFTQNAANGKSLSTATYPLNVKSTSYVEDEKSIHYNVCDNMKTKQDCINLGTVNFKSLRLSEDFRIVESPRNFKMISNSDSFQTPLNCSTKKNHDATKNIKDLKKAREDTCFLKIKTDEETCRNSQNSVKAQISIKSKVLSNKLSPTLPQNSVKGNSSSDSIFSRHDVNQETINARGSTTVCSVMFDEIMQAPISSKVLKNKVEDVQQDFLDNSKTKPLLVAELLQFPPKPFELNLTNQQSHTTYNSDICLTKTVEKSKVLKLVLDSFISESTNEIEDEIKTTKFEDLVDELLVSVSNKDVNFENELKKTFSKEIVPEKNNEPKQEFKTHLFEENSSDGGTLLYIKLPELTEQVSNINSTFKNQKITESGTKKFHQNLLKLHKLEERIQPKNANIISECSESSTEFLDRSNFYRAHDPIVPLEMIYNLLPISMKGY